MKRITITSANSLCRQVGHEWDPDTITPNYRRCCRSQCTAAERLVNGQWIAVDTTARRASHQQTAQQGMPSLWESAHGPAARRCDDEEPTASSALMRRWERQMHALTGREEQGAPPPCKKCI